MRLFGFFSPYINFLGLSPMIDCCLGGGPATVAQLAQTFPRPAFMRAGAFLPGSKTGTPERRKISQATFQAHRCVEMQPLPV
jgi:hypothetical protein